MSVLCVVPVAGAIGLLLSVAPFESSLGAPRIEHATPSPVTTAYKQGVVGVLNTLILANARMLTASAELRKRQWKKAGLDARAGHAEIARAHSMLDRLHAPARAHSIQSSLEGALSTCEYGANLIALGAQYHAVLTVNRGSAVYQRGLAGVDRASVALRALR